MCVSLRVKVNIEDEEDEDNLNEDEGEDGIQNEPRGGLIDEAKGSMEIDGGGYFTAAQKSQASILKVNLNA
jgi:hypothetical protein